jgi:uncharacterized protein YlxW (UPF0749 family)
LKEEESTKLKSDLSSEKKEVEELNKKIKKLTDEISAQ